MLRTIVMSLMLIASSFVGAQNNQDPAAILKGIAGAMKEIEQNEKTKSESPQSMNNNTVGGVLQGGGSILTKGEVTSLFTHGGELSGINSKGIQFNNKLNPDNTYTGSAQGGVYEGKWSVDDQGRICLAQSGLNPACVNILSLNGKFYISPNSGDQNAPALIRNIVSYKSNVQQAQQQQVQPPLIPPSEKPLESNNSGQTGQEQPSSQITAQGTASNTTQPEMKVEEKQVAPITPAPSAQEKPKKTLMEKLLLLTFFGAIVSLCALIIAGMTGNVVIFYDWSDFMNTVFIFVAGLIGLIVTSILSDEATDTITYIGFGITGLIVLGLSVKSIRTSIYYNRNVAVGIVVGLFKIFLALFSIVFVWGKLKEIFGRSSNVGAQIFGVIILGLFAWVLKMLVNGERVYIKKGWQLPSGT